MGLPGTEAALCAPPRLGGSSSLPDPVSRAALSLPARQVREAGTRTRSTEQGDAAAATRGKIRRRRGGRGGGKIMIVVIKNPSLSFPLGPLEAAASDSRVRGTPLGAAEGGAGSQVRVSLRVAPWLVVLREAVLPPEPLPDGMQSRGLDPWLVKDPPALFTRLGENNLSILARFQFITFCPSKISPSPPPAAYPGEVIICFPS